MQLKDNIYRTIYEQIINQVEKMIIRGELKPGDKLPSQRKMAKINNVNPNTIQRAYCEMKDMELVETYRGKGTFIKKNEKLFFKLKKRMTKDVIKRFIQEMESMGYDSCKVLYFLKDYYNMNV